MIKFEYYIDEFTHKSHIFNHDISFEDINEFFNHSKHYEYKRKDDSWVAYGKIHQGGGNIRYLTVIYRKLSKELYHIITSFDLENNNIIDFLENNE